MNSCIEGRPLKIFLTAAFFLALAGGACSAQSEPQSLADVARQNRQNKKAVAVLSDESIASHQGVVSVVGDESARVADSRPASPQKSAVDKAKPAPSDGNSQVAELKKKLDSYKKEQQGWKDSVKEYEDLLANETDDFRRATYQEALDNDTKNTANLQQKIDQTSADLSKAQQEPQTAAAGAKGSQTSGKTSPTGSQQ